MKVQNLNNTVVIFRRIRKQKNHKIDYQSSSIITIFKNN